MLSSQLNQQECRNNHELGRDIDFSPTPNASFVNFQHHYFVFDTVRTFVGLLFKVLFSWGSILSMVGEFGFCRICVKTKKLWEKKKWTKFQTVLAFILRSVNEMNWFEESPHLCATHYSILKITWMMGPEKFFFLSFVRYSQKVG